MRTKKYFLIMFIFIFSKQVLSQDLQEVYLRDSTATLSIAIEKLTPKPDSLGKNEMQGLGLIVQERNSGRVLASIDISHPYYGSLLWSHRQLQIAKSSNGSTLILFQTSFGGDGEHTSNYLIICTYQKRKIVTLLHEQLTDVNFQFSQGNLTGFTGKHIISLCDVCDGDEVADQDDLFYIPLTFKFKNTVVKRFCLLTQSQKNGILKTFADRSKKNIEEHFSYSTSQGKEYKQFVEKVEKKLKNILR